MSQVTEVTGADRLEKFRAEQQHFVGLSFPSIRFPFSLHMYFKLKPLFPALLGQTGQLSTTDQLKRLHDGSQGTSFTWWTVGHSIGMGQPT